MKLKLWNTILILALFFGCKNDRNLHGNYSWCYDGEYAEVYFKQDSMRVASESKWVKLSEWRKIEIKNDTLYFKTFGEFKDSATAVIKYARMNKIKLLVLETDVSIVLESINENLNFENPKKFWNGFNNRQSSMNCKKPLSNKVNN